MYTELAPTFGNMPHIIKVTNTMGTQVFSDIICILFMTISYDGADVDILAVQPLIARNRPSLSIREYL